MISDARQARSRGLWMRAVSFTILRELLAFAAQSSKGLRAKDLDAVAERLKTPSGRTPARTTRYHYRNILLNLGILGRRAGRYFVQHQDPLVQALLRALQPGNPELSLDERYHFANLVLRNADCQAHFFDLFTDGEPLTDLDLFIRHGQPVAWRVIAKQEMTSAERSAETSSRMPVRDRCRGRQHKRRTSPPSPVRIWNLSNGRERMLTLEDERQAILYGVRFWARDELGFLDEIFMERYGNVMFPVEIHGSVPDPRVIEALQERLDPEQEWTFFSVRELAWELCPALKIPLRRFFATLEALYHAYPAWLMWIPTSSHIAAFAAPSTFEEKLQLRSYFRDPWGRYISHFWANVRLREVKPWTIPISA